MKYLNSDITKIASWLFHNEPQNKARYDIYNATITKSHPKNIIEIEFSTETAATIERVRHKIEEAETKAKKKRK